MYKKIIIFLIIGFISTNNAAFLEDDHKHNLNRYNTVGGEILYTLAMEMSGEIEIYMKELLLSKAIDFSHAPSLYKLGKIYKKSCNTTKKHLGDYFILHAANLNHLNALYYIAKDNINEGLLSLGFQYLIKACIPKKSYSKDENFNDFGSIKYTYCEKAYKALDYLLSTFIKESKEFKNFYFYFTPKMSRLETYITFNCLEAYRSKDASRIKEVFSKIAQ